ncbi:MAG: response regulator [Ktedonobacteraceae bacterium]|nr:response regulator [Ktedonobacteraceae bacterium]
MMSEKPRTVKTILMVEDDADIGAIFLHLLVDETPYETVLVTDPLEALEVIKVITPVLFIFNYRLPHMSGLDLYDHFHAQPDLAHIPAVMISANLPKEELAKRGIMGLDKPTDIDDFIEAIKQLIR